MHFAHSLFRYAANAAALVLLACPVVAQDINISAELTTEAALPRVMPRFAKAVITFQDAAKPGDALTLFRAQLVAGLYRDALQSLARIRAPLAVDPSPRVRARYAEYVLYAQAALRAADPKIGFESAYADAFRQLVGSLDDRTAAMVVGGLSADNLTEANRIFAQDLSRIKGSNNLSLSEALDLIRDYNERAMYRAFGTATAALIAQDDARRYSVQKDIVLPTPGGGTVCVLVVRPLTAGKLPALLQFTIYNDAESIFREARRAASNDYAGVIGLTRGKGCSSDTVITPYEHDGADAAAVVDWIAAQPWNDGQVGMYGGSYSGFTPWAAANHQPKALKAIMVGAPNGPGIDAPMEGNVFWNFLYPWPFYTTDNKTLDNATYFDRARWQRLNHDWYASGRAYNDLDKIDGTPNPIFNRWISHPSYDAFWQHLIPYKEEFGRIGIPILETAGYYYGGPGAAVYYFSQHYRYKADAQHYLLIGPYDHLTAQRGTANADGDIDMISGYSLDAAAKIDITELRYQWFDYALKGKPRPALLADKVNFEVTGANTWRHAPSLAAMSQGRVRYYLSRQGATGAQRLTAMPLPTPPVHQSVDFADRRDVDAVTPGGDIQDRALDSTNGLVFLSEPISKPTELSGLFNGHLEFIANKADFDFQVALFELTAGKDYIQLAPYWSRASYVQDLSERHLLTPGKRATLDFTSGRLMSRRLGVGSRVVAVLSIIKEPGREINYGTGKPVADETIMDAKTPLRIDWFPGSYVDLPAN